MARKKTKSKPKKSQQKSYNKKSKSRKKHQSQKKLKSNNKKQVQLQISAQKQTKKKIQKQFTSTQIQKKQKLSENKDLIRKSERVQRKSKELEIKKIQIIQDNNIQRSSKKKSLQTSKNKSSISKRKQKQELKKSLQKQSKSKSPKNQDKKSIKTKQNKTPLQSKLEERKKNILSDEKFQQKPVMSKWQERRQQQMKNWKQFYQIYQNDEPVADYTFLKGISKEDVEICQLKLKIQKKINEGKIVPLILPQKSQFTLQQIQTYNLKQNFKNEAKSNKIKKGNKSHELKYQQSSQQSSDDQRELRITMQDFPKYYLPGIQDAFYPIQFQQQQIDPSVLIQNNYRQYNMTKRYFYKNFDQSKHIFCQQTLLNKHYQDQLLNNYLFILPKLEDIYEKRWINRFEKSYYLNQQETCDYLDQPAINYEEKCLILRDLLGDDYQSEEDEPKIDKNKRTSTNKKMKTNQYQSDQENFHPKTVNFSENKQFQAFTPHKRRIQQRMNNEKQKNQDQLLVNKRPQIDWLKTVNKLYTGSLKKQNDTQKKNQNDILNWNTLKNQNFEFQFSVQEK